MKKRIISLIALLIPLALCCFAQSDSIRITIRTSNGYYISLDDGVKSPNVLKVTTSCGTHKVRITDNLSFLNEWDIEVNNETGTEFKFPLEGSVRVQSNRSKTKVWVDGELIGDAPTELHLVGEHRLTLDAGKNYSLYTQNMMFDPLADYDMMCELKKARAQLNGFIIANFMLTANAPGVMMGMGRRFGGFLKANYTIGASLETSSHEYPTSNLPAGNYKKIHDYMGASVGVTYRPIDLATVYLGGGVASYQGAEFDGGHVEVVAGPQIEAGVILKFKALLLQAGYTRILSTSTYGHKFGAFNIGVGINIHKEKNQRLK